MQLQKYPSSSTYNKGLTARHQNYSKNLLKKQILKAKVVVVGNSGVGKTSLCMWHDGQNFQPKINLTFGSSFILAKTEHIEKEVHLQIWDTAGQERFRSLVPMYLRNSVAAIIVYAITDRKSFEAINSWIKEIRRVNCDCAQFFIIANKCDLSDWRCVTRAEGEEFAVNHNSRYFETSALNGRGIESALHEVANTLLNNIQTEMNTSNGICLNTDKNQFFNSITDIKEKGKEKISRSICCTIL